MTIDYISFVLGFVLGLIVLGIFFWVSQRKKSHLWEMKKLILEASKEIHSAYDKIQTLYQVVDIADKKRRLEK